MFDFGITLVFGILMAQKGLLGVLLIAAACSLGTLTMCIQSNPRRMTGLHFSKIPAFTVQYLPLASLELFCSGTQRSRLKGELKTKMIYSPACR